MLPSGLLTGLLLAADQSLPLRLRALLCDLSSRFLPKGRVGSATYRDVAVRTPDGWRLARRTAILRRSEDW